MVDIKYTIKGFNPENGILYVMYYTDEVSEINMVLDLPIVNGEFISGVELDTYIKTNTPRYQIERLASLKSIKVPEELLEYVGHTDKPAEPKHTSARQHRFELLLETDWTQLPDVKLNPIEKAAWDKYRQELRDITLQPGFPDNVVYPLSPNIEPR